MKYYVFDLYGTLVDIRTDEYSQKFKEKYQKYLSKNYGADGTFFERFTESLNSFTGFTEPDIVHVLHGCVIASGGNMSEKEAEAAAVHFRKLSTHKLRLYRGARKLLKGLKSKGAKIYLLSNAQAAFTVPELKKLGIYGYFDGIELSSDFGEKKPSPSFFKHVIAKYGLDVSKTVYTGNDISSDIVPAKNAGMCAVYIKSGISPADDSLAEAGKIADFLYEGNFSAVAQRLLALSKS